MLPQVLRALDENAGEPHWNRTVRFQHVEWRLVESLLKSRQVFTKIQARGPSLGTIEPRLCTPMITAQFTA
jgi:hypothetical protein